MRKCIMNLSSYIMLIGLFLCQATSTSNAQNIENIKYETYKKVQAKETKIEEDLPEEVKSDIESSMNIKYLKKKSNSKYEVAYAHPD